MEIGQKVVHNVRNLSLFDSLKDILFDVLEEFKGVGLEKHRNNIYQIVIVMVHQSILVFIKFNT